MHSYRSKDVALIVLFALWLLPCVQAQQHKSEQVVVLTLVGRPLPIAVGEMRGTFAKHGIEVKTQNFANSGLMRKALADGTGNLAYAAVDNAVAMVELTGASVAIVSGGEGSQNELIVQPGIDTFDNLRGKTLLVDAVNTAYAVQLKGILLLHGMRAGQDYQLNAYGATPLRAALLHRGQTERSLESRLRSVDPRSLPGRRPLRRARLGAAAPRHVDRLSRSLHGKPALADGSWK